MLRIHLLAMTSKSDSDCIAAEYCHYPSTHYRVIARNEVTWQSNSITSTHHRVIARNEVTWQSNSITSAHHRVIARNEVTWQSNSIKSTAFAGTKAISEIFALQRNARKYSIEVFFLTLNNKLKNCSLHLLLFCGIMILQTKINLCKRRRK